MGLVRFFLKGMSENKLRATEKRMRKKLSLLNYNSKKHTKLDLRRIDVVNEIARRSSGKLPKRNHGWYVSKGD